MMKSKGAFVTKTIDHCRNEFMIHFLNSEYENPRDCLVEQENITEPGIGFNEIRYDKYDLVDKQKIQKS